MPSLHSFARHHFPRLFPENEGHGQGLIIITGCNELCPGIDLGASPLESQPDIQLEWEGGIHLKSRETCNSARTKEEEGEAYDGPLPEIHALAKAEKAVLAGSAHKSQFT